MHMQLENYREDRKCAKDWKENALKSKDDEELVRNSSSSKTEVEIIETETRNGKKSVSPIINEAKDLEQNNNRYSNTIQFNKELRRKRLRNK